ncbi:ski oncogene-like isoform X2 [Argonauta hians]
MALRPSHRVSPHIQRVLKHYQSTAIRSLCGPNASLVSDPYTSTSSLAGGGDAGKGGSLLSTTSTTLDHHQDLNTQKSRTTGRHYSEFSVKGDGDSSSSTTSPSPPPLLTTTTTTTTTTATSSSSSSSGGGSGSSSGGGGSSSCTAVIRSSSSNNPSIATATTTISTTTTTNNNNNHYYYHHQNNEKDCHSSSSSNNSSSSGGGGGGGGVDGREVASTSSNNSRSSRAGSPPPPPPPPPSHPHPPPPLSPALASGEVGGVVVPAALCNPAVVVVSAAAAGVATTTTTTRPRPSRPAGFDEDEEVLVYRPLHRKAAMCSVVATASSTNIVNPTTSSSSSSSSNIASGGGSSSSNNTTTNKLPSEKGLDFDPFRSPPPYPIQQMPVFTPYDSYAERSETILENERIACFIIGGEKRLCLPQILNSVLRHFNLTQINSVCDELHIFCARCSPEQLETFVAAGILPCRTASCGLITKTDAERLCHALLYKRSAIKPVDPPSPSSFKVYHECFGKCKGIIQPDRYHTPDSECIYCTECQALFNPQQFVCHSHTPMENRICHWGFDSAHWRNYLMLAKDQENLDKCQDIIDQIKNKFDGCKTKRKQQNSEDWLHHSKRVKTEESPPSQVTPWSPHHSAQPTMAPVSAYSAWPQSLISALKDNKYLPQPPSIMRDSLPRSLPSYLQTGPPVLLHPERVIPHSESARYERHFTPNVSLAPLPQQRLPDSKIKSELKESELDRNGLHQLADAAMAKISKEPVSLTVKDSKAYHETTTTATTTTSSSSSSSSSTNLSKHKDKAYDFSSDSEESITEFEETGDEPLSPKLEDTFDIELDMVKQALEGKVGDCTESKRKFLHDFTNLRSLHQQRLHLMDRSRQQLRDLLTKVRSTAKTKMLRCRERKKKLQKRLENMRIETECRLHDAEEGKERLLKEIDTLNKQIEPKELHQKYIQANKELQLQLQQYQTIFETFSRENAILQDELRKRGISFPLVSHPSPLHHSPLPLILSSPSSKSSASPENLSPQSRAVVAASTHERIKMLYQSRNKPALQED